MNKCYPCEVGTHGPDCECPECDEFCECGAQKHSMIEMCPGYWPEVDRHD